MVINQVREPFTPPGRVDGESSDASYSCLNQMHE